MSDEDPNAAGRRVLRAPAVPAGTAGERGASPVLHAEGIEKHFGVTRAVTGCSLELLPGEVHVLMGENGSGKSTMVKILSGVHRPNAGTISLGDAANVELRSPRAAGAAGIATVFQEILVAPQRSVLENTWLGEHGVFRYPRSQDDRRAMARGAIGRLITVPDLDQPVGELGLNDRQAICIARALLRKPKLLILDEATSALDITTRDRLFTVLGELCAQSVAVLFISHRMDEVERIGDRVTVMRSGANVASGVRGEFDSRQLVQLMVGGDHAVSGERQAAARESLADAPARLRVSDLRLRPASAPVNIEIRAGEIVGVAGLEGHGQDEFLRTIYGDQGVSGRVLAITDAGEVEIDSRARALNSGVAYVPRDRRDEAIFPSLSTLENFGIASTGEDRTRGFLQRRSTRSRFDEFKEQMRIVAPRVQNRITTLSGGNQQKVIIARWLAIKPRVLVLNDPTRGVDLGAKNDIYKVLSDIAATGTAVVMLSTELIELIELMDRVLVFREGGVFRELQREELTRNRLVASYFGQEAD
ncbi:MAG TPA: sugar ABC transporter ATP-binding protein [Solirubrobacteraceae bacterium]|nr:sugar ABC transporter ATP-binding protein [Solirubrobacteraceae bacterium]